MQLMRSKGLGLRIVFQWLASLYPLADTVEAKVFEMNS